ncbi:MAG TPA: hypothetical protein VIM60_01390, partial [Edaphobacter sp.]
KNLFTKALVLPGEVKHWNRLQVVMHNLHRNVEMNDAGSAPFPGGLRLKKHLAPAPQGCMS